MDCIRQGEYSFSDDSIGIVSPTYFWALPSIVKRIPEKAAFNTDYLYFISTYGTTPGASGYAAGQAIHGRTIDAFYPFAWPIRGLRSSISPRRKRRRYLPKPRKRSLTERSAGSVNDAPTGICHRASQLSLVETISPADL